MRADTGAAPTVAKPEIGNQEISWTWKMLRHGAICSYCGTASQWCGDVTESREEICRHLKEAHGIERGVEGADFRSAAQRQCDYCLEPYLDDCTKCRHDFCWLHAGDIDGLCGGCI